MASHSLYRLVLFGGLGGYEIAAALTSILGMDSTPASVLVRAVVASSALGVILLDVDQVFSRRKRLILGFCLFWYLYSLRVAYALTFSAERLGFPGWYYWSWSLGACALPMVALSLWRPSLADAERNFMTLFIALGIGGALASFGATSMEVTVNNDVIETGRLQLTALNPILLGQLGATLLVLSLWALISQFGGRAVWVRVMFISAAAVGGGLLIGANSRGPLVSAAMCLLFMAIASSQRSRLYTLLVLFVAAAGFAPVAKQLEESYGFSTYTRLFGQSQLTEENTLDRLSRFDGAFHAFMSNPLLGSSLEEPTHGGYPHNILVEALMTTGFLGGLLLLLLVLSVFVKAVRIYAMRPAYGWVSLLFVQHVFAVQFSGSINTVNYFWLAAGLVISVHSTIPSRKKRALPAAPPTPIPTSPDVLSCSNPPARPLGL